METAGLWKTGFALLGAAVVIKGVKHIQEEYLDDDNDKPKMKKRGGYGLW